MAGPLAWDGWAMGWLDHGMAGPLDGWIAGPFEIGGGKRAGLLACVRVRARVHAHAYMHSPNRFWV